MATQDTACTLGPYFKVHSGKLAEFKKLAEQFVSTTQTEAKCLYYGFCFDDDQAYCREGYADADGVLAHLGNVDSLLKQALEIADITRLEVHGPQAELNKLKGPLGDLNPQYFVLEYGIRN